MGSTVQRNKVPTYIYSVRFWYLMLVDVAYMDRHTLFFVLIHFRSEGPIYFRLYSTCMPQSITCLSSELYPLDREALLFPFGDGEMSQGENGLLRLDREQNQVPSSCSNHCSLFCLEMLGHKIEGKIRPFMAQEKILSQSYNLHVT